MRVKRRRPIAMLAVLAAALLALGVGACGSDDSGEASGSTSGGSSTSNGAGKDFTIGWVPPTVAPFEKALRQGIQEQADALGMKLVVAGGKFDPKVQISAVDSLVDRDVDAILIWPLDEKGIQPALDRAREKKIPILTVVSPGARANVNFQTNDAQAAAQLAEYAGTSIGSPCRVGIIEGVPVVPTLKARNAGYSAGAEKAGCEVLDKQTNTNDTPEKAGEIVSAWKTRFGDEMNGILAINDPSALAALAQTGGDFKPQIFGANGDAEAIKAIEEGRLGGTQAAPSPEIGNGMAYAAHQLLTNETVPGTIEVRYDIVTKDNVGDYRSYEDRLAAPMKVTFQGSGDRALLVAEPGS